MEEMLQSKSSLIYSMHVLHHRQVSKAWKNALIVLIHKKRNTLDIKNYKPISLLPITYKVFSNILLKRIICTLVLPPTT